MNRPQQNDVSKPPVSPQFQLGASSDDAKVYAEITANKLPNQGAIADRLGQQFRLPRYDRPDASPYAYVNSDRFRNNLGEVG